MLRRSSGLLASALVAFAASTASGAERPDHDRALAARSSPAATAALARAMADPALRQVAQVAHLERRYALPTFLWATRAPAPALPAPASAARSARVIAADAARAHLDRVAAFYRLDRADVAEATLRHLHDTGRGGLIAAFVQVIDGVEVFRDELKVMMDRQQRLIAVSGYLPSRSLLGDGQAREFRLGPAEAVARSLEDLTGAAVAPGLVRPAPGGRGGYQTFALAGEFPGFLASQPLRAKPVWFHLPETLMPAFYVELMGQEDAYAYVIAARDGEVLWRHNLVVADAYAYRVWADAAPPHHPWEGPQGTAPSPHPTGVPNLYNPPFVAPQLVTLQNGPISTNDPWLPPAAGETVGNNVDAYVDLNSPDGLGAGDFRATTTTSPGTFDRTYDMNLEPFASTAQRMAAIAQLFYTTNLLHDRFYDSGFDEAAGNAQASNFGRGGVEGDPIRAEGQDYSGINNANMATPADGGQPRMQMYIWNRAAGTLNVSAPGPIAGDYHAGTAAFGPQTFSLSGTVVAAVDGAAPTGDACSALLNAVAGKIVLFDRGGCGFVTPVLNAQAAGAIGAILVDNVDHGNPISLGGSGSVTIPVLSVTLDVGNAIKAQLPGIVSVTMTRATPLWRDGTIDNQVIAHEWGHYISHRLVGNSGGLSTLQSGGMGEGWSDFQSLLLTARPGDDFDGVYPMGSHAISTSTAPTNVYYYGIRRYPYSTDMTRNPLTFQHIQTGVPLPVGPPVAFGSDGLTNAQVHRTGEVWCSMLWECYAALLNDSGRLTFTEAQQRMRDYLVAGFKMTPNGPTFTEARDAILAAAAASDPADLAAFWAAFAKRGCGTGAVSPDRDAPDNLGVIESYAVGGDLAVTEASMTPTISCDGDAYLDNGELGTLSLTVRNVGASVLSATQVTVTSTHPGVSFPDGNVVALPATGPFTDASTTLAVRLTGASGLGVLDFLVEADDPGLLVAGPRSGSTWAYGHADEGASAAQESFEAASDVWTTTGDSGPSVGWIRRSYAAGDRRLYAFDPGTTTDAAAMTPVLSIGGGGPFRLHFDHAYRLEETYDGGVIEISTDGGANWTDIGGLITTGGYTGTLVPGSALAGRPAWTGTSPGYPALTPVTVDLGLAYAGQSVRVRFRTATDGGVGDEGWSIAGLTLENNLTPVFPTLVDETSPCGPVAVGDEGRPAALAFTMAGANPVRGPVAFRLALPEAAEVEVAVYDVAGRQLALLARGMREAGVHRLAWDPAAGGVRPAAGLYFARLTTGGHRLTRRVIAMP